MKNHDVLFIVILILLVLIIGYLFCSMRFANVYIEHSIVPMDIISILVSSAVTLYVGSVITKSLSEQRAEKDILIEDLRSLEELVQDVERKINTSSEVTVSEMSISVQSVMVRVERIKQTTNIFCENSKISTANLYESCANLYTVATDFSSEKLKVDDYPCDAVQHCCSGVVGEIRHLIHNININ